MTLRRLVVPCIAALSLLAASPAIASSHIPSGYYQCYQTIRDVSPVNGEVSYSTIFAKSFTLFRNGTYNVPQEGTYNGYNHWKFANGTLKFRTGPFWSGFRHAVGHYKKAGSTMPNSQLSPALRYPLVLRDTRRNDADELPQRGSADATLWYCRKR
jgi:hypothetical protein